jgi:cobalt-zinc-cadmium efflux system protein
LLRDTTNILLQGVPRGVDLDAVRGAIADVAGVASVHDLHLWSVAGDDRSLTAHIVIDASEDEQQVRQRVADQLHDRFEIEHATLQIERGDAACEKGDHV